MSSNIDTIIMKELSIQKVSSIFNYYREKVINTNEHNLYEQNERSAVGRKRDHLKGFGRIKTLYGQLTSSMSISYKNHRNSSLDRVRNLT